MQALAFQESPQLSLAGRASLGDRYHKALVGPLEELLGRARGLGWIRPPLAGEAPRVWIFMGLLSAFFAPGHEQAAEGERDAKAIEAESTAFASLLLRGIAS